MSDQFTVMRLVLEEIRDTLVADIRREVNRCYQNAMDYENKYSFSSDYDKSFKKKYYQKAEGYEALAESLKKLQVTRDAGQVAGMVEELKQAVEQLPLDNAVKTEYNRRLDDLPAME